MLRALPLQAVYALERPVERFGAVGFRGALGAALMDILCVREHRACTRCDVATSCQVPGWFDPGRLGSSAPRPISIRSIDIDGTGSALSVVLVLHGIVEDKDSFVAALRRSGRQGFGKRRVSAALSQLIAWTGGPGTLVVDGGRTVATLPDPSGVGRLVAGGSAEGVRLLSPLRVDRANTRPTGALLVKSAIRRVRALAAWQGVSLDRRWPDPAELQDGRVELTRVDAARWSARQKARIDLSGWVGELECDGLEPFEDLLAVAEVLQVGRYTSVGLGVVEQLSAVTGPAS